MEQNKAMHIQPTDLRQECHDGEHTLWGKDNLFHKWCWKTGQLHAKEQSWTLILHHTKINSKWIKDLNVRPEAIELLEESTGEKLPDTGLSKDILDMTPKAQATKAKIDKWDNIKLKKFYTAKEASNKIQRQPTEWEKIFAYHLSDKGSISKIYKELIQLNSKKPKQSD